MSLLIKALDKAQAEKTAQAKSAKAKKPSKAELQKKKPVKSKKKPKDAKNKKSKSQKTSKAAKANVETLGLTALSETITTKKSAATVPKALQQSAAAKEMTTEAETLSIAPLEEKASLSEKPLAKSNAPAKQPQQRTVAAETKTKQPQAQSLNRVEESQPERPPAERAANVFSAKQLSTVERRHSKMPIILGAGLIALLALAAYYYQFVDHFPEPEEHVLATVAPSKPAALTEPVNESVEQAVLPEIEPAIDESVAALLPDEAVEPAVITEQPVETEALIPAETIKEETQAPTQAFNNTPAPVESTLVPTEEVVAVNSPIETPNEVVAKKVVISQSASIEITKNKSERGINPILMRAYDAYSAGNDVLARQSYKDVLRQDSLNVDAMLGLAAIATRQDRNADANGWYRKVLSVEPRNATAQSGILFLQNQTSGQANESQIKSMLATSPGDANLHVALANLYADKNQWAAAQEAYFEAYRLNQTAENAYNLAVSLDQLNKPKVALPYYQQALATLSQSNNAAIDQAALEARIAAIQSF